MKIASVEVTPVSQRVRPDLAIISAAGKHPESHYLFVKISSDEGISGYGEATLAHVWSGESQATAQALIRDVLAPLLVGKQSLHLNVMTDAMDRFLIGNRRSAPKEATTTVERSSLSISCRVISGRNTTRRAFCQCDARGPPTTFLGIGVRVHEFRSAAARFIQNSGHDPWRTLTALSQKFDTGMLKAVQIWRRLQSA